MKIIIDTREKLPLKFTDVDEDDIIVKKLDTGDYSIDGYENILFIERKSSFMEFYGNLTEERFWNELDRTTMFKHKFLILQFDIDNILNFPYGTGLSREKMSKLKLTSAFLLKRLIKIMTVYNINVIFAGNYDNACRIVEKIMREIYVQEKI